MESECIICGAPFQQRERGAKKLTCSERCRLIRKHEMESVWKMEHCPTGASEAVTTLNEHWKPKFHLQHTLDELKEKGIDYATYQKSQICVKVELPEWAK